MLHLSTAAHKHFKYILPLPSSLFT